MRTTLPLLAALPVLHLGCGLSCTEIGCFAEGTYIALYERSLEDWRAEAGSTFAVTVQAAGTTVTCEGTLDDGVDCDAATVFVRLFDVETDAGAVQGIERIELSFEPWPDEVTLTVAQDGTEVFDETLLVEPEVNRPNGPGCEPECRYWVGEVDW